MNAAIFLAGTQAVGMVLSFILLLRVRLLSVGLSSRGPSYQRLSVGSDAEQPADRDQVFRA